MAAKEVLQRLVQEEAQEEPPRERQRQHERRERTPRRPDPDVAEARPVHLPLFASKRPPPQERLVPARPQIAYPVAHLPHAKRTASLAQHVPQPRRPSASDTARAFRARSPRTDRTGSVVVPPERAENRSAPAAPSRGAAPVPSRSFPPASARRSTSVGSVRRPRHRSPLPPAGESMRGPGRPHTTQTSHPSRSRGATITAAPPALTGLAGTVDRQTPSWEP